MLAAPPSQGSSGVQVATLPGAAPPDGGVQGAVADSQTGLNCRKSPISAHGGQH